jgi:hypothetical protein
MFHETLGSPFLQCKKFMSPDVCGLPFWIFSMHTVITPLRIPGGLALLLAPANEATAPNTTTTPATSAQLTLGNFAMEKPPFCIVGASLPLPNDAPGRHPRHCVTD